MQTKTVNTPIAPSRSSTKPNAWGAAAMPTAVVQSDASQDSNGDVMSQASGDASSVISKTEEAARAGTAGSVTADDEPVPETSGAHSSATPQDVPHSRSRVQVSAWF